MIEQLFKDVTDRLSQVESLRWVDLDFGQLENPGENYAVQFPCALVDIAEVQYQDETEGNQQAVVMLAVKLALDIYEDYHIADGVEAPQRDTAFQRLAMIEEVHKALQGWEGEYFTPLTRVDIVSEKNEDFLKVFSMQYKTQAIDYSAGKKYDTVENLEVRVFRLVNQGGE